MGFTGTVTERLEADRRRAVAETEATAAPSTAGASTAVVLRERSGAVEDELHRRYLERIPVIALDEEELFDFFLDEAALRAALA